MVINDELFDDTIINEVPITYSSIKFQPITNATNSPMQTYV